RNIVFAIQATPTKPMPSKPKPWRNWLFNGQPHTQDTMRIAIAGSGYSWGTYSAFSNIYPRNKDFSIFEMFQKARETGKINRNKVKEWLAGYNDVKTKKKQNKYRREVTWGM